MRSRAIVVMASLSAALITGGWLVERGLGKSGQNATDRARLLDNVMGHVSRFYVDSLSDEQLYEKALVGMLHELGDPHSYFLEPDRLRKLNENTSGNYGGLGLRVDVRDGWITVLEPLPGTPAEHAGVQTGDRIVEIAGASTHGWSMDEALKALRGAPGTAVKMIIERPGGDARMPVTLTRQQIHDRAVQRVAMLRDGVGYLDVNVFSENTAHEMEQGIDSLVKQGLRTLVIDLRGNPGGLLDQGVAVSDLFLDPGKTVVSMKGRTGDANHVFLDRAPQRWPSLPVIVLVNAGSASASEIVAGALQDHDRALIVGSQTYGKGSAQSLFPMTGGGALKLTTALWYTPSGRSINKPIASHDDANSEQEPDTSAAKRARFRTDDGRIVYGGGGISPDIAAGDTAARASDIAFARAIGRQASAYRDALTEMGLAAKTQHTLASPDFSITPAMRDDLWQRLQRHGVKIDRATYDSAATLVTRQLAYELARYAFGTTAEFHRRAQDDAVIQTALALANGARTQKELFARAARERSAHGTLTDSLTRGATGAKAR